MIADLIHETVHTPCHAVENSVIGVIVVGDVLSHLHGSKRSWYPTPKPPSLILRKPEVDELEESDTGNGKVAFGEPPPCLVQAVGNGYAMHL